MYKEKSLHFVFTVKRYQHSRREHCRQRWYKGSLLGVPRMGTKKSRGAEIARPSLYSWTIVLDQRSKHLVQHVQTGGNEASHHNWLPQSRQIPCSGSSFEHGGVLQGFQLPAWLENESRKEMRRLVKINAVMENGKIEQKLQLTRRQWNLFIVLKKRRLSSECFAEVDNLIRLRGTVKSKI